MGFFKKAAPVRIDIPFDADWADAWESLRKQQENKPFAADIGVSFDEQLLRDIWNSIESHTATERIVYDEEIQPINNVELNQYLFVFFLILFILVLHTHTHTHN